MRVAAVVAVLVSGCTKATPKEPETTVPTAPAVTTAAPATTTAPADPFAVPTVVDVAYVDRVLAALDQVRGDAVRSIVLQRRVDAAAIERIRAIYNDPAFQISAESIQMIPSEDLTRYKAPPGDRRTRVQRIVSSGPSCVVFESIVDFSAVVLNPPPHLTDERDVMVLAPTQPGADPKELNPTPWSIRYAAVIKTGQVAEGATCTG
ncbi:MAG: hypothetical protein ACR2MO_13075 [Acidimicrobiales bacterium]